MKLEVVDILSIASGRDNEDRAGAAPPLAWVIDGATDVLPEPLTRGPTDAAWFAGAMQEAMTSVAATPPPSLIDLPQIIADRLGPLFKAAAKRAIIGPDEQPSAAAIVVRCTGDNELEYVSLGDCALMLDSNGEMTKIGVDDEQAGDRWVADALRGQAIDATTQQAPLTRAGLLPRLRAQRALMNTTAGYGIFSVTAPPRAMIKHGLLPVSPGDRILLASDGLMRLVDVFRTYDADRLFAAAWSEGLAPLFEELRALERLDANCSRYPRAKTSDDTTAMLLRVTASA